MSETRATIRGRVALYVGTAITSTVNEAIKDGLIAVQRTHNFRHMEYSTTISVAAGASTFTLPNDFKSELNPEMSDSDGTGYRRMTKVLKDGINARNTDDEGRPLLYRIWQGAGILYGKADQAYTFPLEYYRWLPNLTSDDAITDAKLQAMVDEAAPAIQAFAIAEGFRRLGDYDKAVYWQNDKRGLPLGIFETRLKALIDDDIEAAVANADLFMQLPG